MITVYALDDFSEESLRQSGIVKSLTVAPVLFRSLIQNGLQVHSDVLQERNGESNAILVFVETLNPNKAIGFCEIEIMESRYQKDLFRYYVRKFLLFPSWNDRKNNVACMKLLEETLKTSPGAMIWISEPYMEQIPWWIEVKLIGAHEKEHFHQMTGPMKNAEEGEFEHFLYIFLKDNLLYPIQLIKWVMSHESVKKALEFRSTRF